MDKESEKRALADAKCLISVAEEMEWTAERLAEACRMVLIAEKEYASYKKAKREIKH